MDLLHPICAGLDVRSTGVIACVRREIDGAVTYELRRFAHSKEGLRELTAWLCASGCTHAAMEPRGELWRPIRRALSGHPMLVVTSMRNFKNVPARKQAGDAQWLAELLAHGLVVAIV